LVKIRNPWRSEQYRGPYNDKDRRWTSDLKKAANLESANDGIFWIPKEDFVKAFDVLEVSHIVKNAKINYFFNENVG